MSQELFDELFDTHYPKNGELVREETRAKLREKTYAAIVESVSNLECVIKTVKDLTPTKPQELYDAIGGINHLPIWQVKGMPMLYNTYKELTEPFQAAFDTFYNALDERRGFFLRKGQLTSDELLLMRDATLQAATILMKWVMGLHPNPPQQ